MGAREGFGVASLILGVLAMVFFWFFPLGMALSVLAIVLSVRQTWIKPTGLSTAGLILGVLALVFSTVIFAFWIAEIIVIFG